MIDEHQGQCIYENGRFRLREETDYAIIDELEDFPPIMVQMEETDDGSESQYADRRGVLHLMNQLADTNPNEQRHFYLKYRLDKVHNDNDLLRKENEQLRQKVGHFKAQLYCKNEDGVCLICNNHYLVKGKTYDKYYISKCKKEHDECSTEILRYCKDFELKGD